MNTIMACYHLYKLIWQWVFYWAATELHRDLLSCLCPWWLTPSLRFTLFFPSISCRKYLFSFVHSNLCMCAVWCQASNVQAVFRAVLVKKDCLLWLKNYTASLVRENYNEKVVSWIAKQWAEIWYKALWSWAVPQPF